MKALKALFVFSLVLSWSGSVLAQDPVKVDPTHYKVILENASVRVLKIDYAPGSKSVMHQHPDAIAVPLTASKIQFSMADGKSETQELPVDSALYTPAGTHLPANIGSTRVDVILVEFKGAAPGKATIPTSRDGLTIKPLAEGPRATATRTTVGPKFTEPAGTKHDYDQVIIALQPGQVSLSIDGKPAKTTWARGDVQFIGRGTGHETNNTGGKPVDLVIVAIK
jgi:quercetin dioxygenase-like cupin family protein